MKLKRVKTIDVASSASPDQPPDGAAERRNIEPQPNQHKGDRKGNVDRKGTVGDTVNMKVCRVTHESMYDRK